VDSGKLLSDYDIDYLQNVFQDANHNRGFAMRFPEYASIVCKIAQLYEHITNKALENERARQK
jgi:hypothetical protein